MKKNLALVITGILAMSALTACGSSKPAETTAAATTQAATTAAATEAAKEAETEKAEHSDENE